MAVSLKKGVYIVAGKRTPFGKLGGMLRECPCDDLFATAATAALQAGGVPPDAIDTVNIGQVLYLVLRSVGTQYKATLSSKHAALKAGVPPETPVLAVNKLSGSALHAIIISAHRYNEILLFYRRKEVLLGSAQVSLAGGMDNFSLAPHLLCGARFDASPGEDLVIQSWLYRSYYDTYCNMQLSEMSDLIARDYKISRGEADEYALRSQMNWKTANENCVFKDELAPVTVTKDGRNITLNTDEFPRPDTTMDSLSRHKPMYEDGVTTIANVSGMNDGAGAVVIASEAAISQHSLTPLGRVSGWACVGVQPARMGLGPVPAVRALLGAVGLNMDDVDLVEIHETFATQVVACARELRVDGGKLNVDGGAISIGHPSGASGARLVAHLTHQLRRRHLKRGIISMGVAGGQGMALLVESV